MMEIAIDTLSKKGVVKIRSIDVIFCSHHSSRQTRRGQTSTQSNLKERLDCLCTGAEIVSYVIKMDTVWNFVID